MEVQEVLTLITNLYARLFGDFDPQQGHLKQLVAFSSFPHFASLILRNYNNYKVHVFHRVMVTFHYRNAIINGDI